MGFKIPTDEGPGTILHFLKSPRRERGRKGREKGLQEGEEEDKRGEGKRVEEGTEERNQCWVSVPTSPARVPPVSGDQEDFKAVVVISISSTTYSYFPGGPRAGRLPLKSTIKFLHEQIHFQFLLNDSGEEMG